MNIIKNPDFIKFDTFNNAVIDSSSIIYMKKTGFYFLIEKHIDLHIIKEVEYEIIKGKLEEPADIAILKYAKKRKLPIISEDKNLLTKANKENLAFYNSIMILIFLRYKQVINKKEFEVYKKKLYQIARYSSFVKEYAANLISLLPPF